MEDDRLHIVITYKFPSGELFEENALFRKPDLMQEQWSWKESKGSHVHREFTADLVAKTASAHIHKDNEKKDPECKSGASVAVFLAHLNR